VLALTSTWSGDATEDVVVSGRLESIGDVPPLSAFEADLSNSSAIARWATEMARREQVVSLARAGRIPDVDLGAGYRRLHETSEHALVIGATFAVPWFDKRSDAVAAATLRAEAATAEAAAALVAARELLATTHNVATTAAAALGELDGRVIPLSQRAYDAILAGYEAGRFPLGDLLDARRVLTAARRDRVDALGRLTQSIITMQRLVGAPPIWPGAASEGVR
jgi:cobalt-zinc-cadmium efflux system outer membrane protein